MTPDVRDLQLNRPADLHCIGHTDLHFTEAGYRMTTFETPLLPGSEGNNIGKYIIQ